MSRSSFHSFSTKTLYFDGLYIFCGGILEFYVVVYRTSYCREQTHKSFLISASDFRMRTRTEAEACACVRLRVRTSTRAEIFAFSARSAERTISYFRVFILERMARRRRRNFFIPLHLHPGGGGGVRTRAPAHTPKPPAESPNSV